MMLREEAIELLSGAHDPQLIPVVLEKLGLDPEAQEFPEDVLEQAEVVFKKFTLEELLNTKALPQAQTSPMIVSERVAIAHQSLLEQDISIPGDVLMLIAQSVIRRGRSEANALTELYKQSFVNQLQEGQQDLSQIVMSALGGKSILEENLERMTQAIAPKNKAIDVTAYLAEVRPQLEAQKQQKQLKQQETQKRIEGKKPVIDVNAFLAEVSEW